MLTIERLSRKAQEITLESKQNLASLLNRKKVHLSAEDQQIISDLNRDGVHVTSIEHLFKADAAKIMAVFLQAAAELNVEPDQEIPVNLRKMTCSIDMTPEAVLSHYPEIFFLCLSDRIINLVEAYLGLDAAYHGVALRRSITDGLEVGPRLWHKDAEDFRTVRIVVYLNDVIPGGGPFEYIPRSYGLDYKDLKQFDGKLTAENMLKAVPESVIRQVYGKAGTVVISDAANTFHHEKLQTSQCRSVAMYGFSTRMPKRLELAKSHFPVEKVKDRLSQMLSPGMVPYVQGWRV
jgi:hypothetical protein